MIGRGLGLRTIAIALPALLLAACESVVPDIGAMMTSEPPSLCSGDGLRIDIDFAAAGRHNCIIGPDGSVVISVDHEPTFVEGINPSPWFAFRVTTEAAREATFTLDYTDYNHRYAPWFKPDGGRWDRLPASSVTLNERKTRATLKLSLAPGGTVIAGQPVSSAADNIGWTRAALAGRSFNEQRYGVSREGRDLVGFVGGGSLSVIVALTRQHPPETSGQEAYRGFVERLMTRDDSMSNTFRARHKIILAPMPNPDGVDSGNWRLNAGGLDLNRDWGKFTQPETKALSDWIVAQAGGRPVVSMLDFHSTDRTVIYAPPLDSASPTIDLLPYLKQALDTAIKPAPEWSYSHNPDGGTSKGWALEALKAPGLTIELWDQIPPADARRIGATIADALIEHFDR